MHLRSLFRVTILVLFLALGGCEKESTFQLGDVQNEFQSEIVYKAETDGFLVIHYSSNWMGDNSFIKVFSDSTQDPSTLIGTITITGTLMLPIKRNCNWKVVLGTSPINDFSIMWYPIIQSK